MISFVKFFATDFERKIANSMDVPRLISEICLRPPLWNMGHSKYKDRGCQFQLWQEVAEIVGSDVDECKRKWKNLRDAYRAEVKRSQRRMERAKMMGDYDPNTNYNSKWVYFRSMSFVNNTKQNISSTASNAIDYESSHNDDDEDANMSYNDDTIHGDNDHSSCDIKLEYSHDMEEDLQQLVHDHKMKDDEDEAANDMLFEEFENIATPQAARRLSATLLMNNPSEQKSSEELQQIPKASIATNLNCQCSKRTDDQLHFLEDLGREEQKLMISTRQDITRTNKLDHIGDSDYNFLVSFLPQMKKMSDLQNLQFRAKVCDMVLNIFTPSTAVPITCNMNVQPIQEERSTQIESSSGERSTDITNSIDTTNADN